jgi:hypothetical protein
MSITTTSTKDSYTGNNSTSTPYPITFKYLEDSHITVYVDGVALSNSYYTLTGDGSLGTGQFTTALAYAGTQKVVVVLDVPFNQPVELLETGVLSSSTLEEAYDRLNMQIRRVWRKAQSVLTFSTDEGGAGSQGTADNLLGFDGTGNLTEIPNATFAQAANNLSDVTATTARSNLNVDVAGTDNSTDVTLAGTGTQASLVGQALTINKITAGDLNSESATVGQVLQSDGDTTCSFVDLVGGGNAQTTNPLSQFASTTSAQLASVISDETGTGALVFADAPTIDLTNATNTPLPASGTVTETMLNASTNASLDKADTSVQVANNLSDVTASTARTNLGLAIGSDVQAHSSVLDDIVTLPSVTGTATFTNSTNNIALTGIGSLTGLSVGDVIEVTGSTSNNDVFTVETITDTGNVIVNAEHAGGTTGKSLTLETATASVTVTLVCKAKNAPIGYGQGWVNLIASRSKNTIYTNSTGRTIAMGFRAEASSSGGSVVLEVDGVDVFVFQGTSSGNDGFVTGIIPNESTYDTRGTNGIIKNEWNELR